MRFSFFQGKQGFSAPEDTSAKESSAGDTECDDDRSLSSGGAGSCSKVCFELYGSTFFMTISYCVFKRTL